jgi:DNA-binding NarL/FixJ family response regulator
VRLAIAEDSGLFRSSLTMLLKASGAEVTASVASGPELLDAIGANLPDAVIVDIRMPPTFTDEGISTAAELRRLYPHVGALVLSTYAETSYASQLLETVHTGVGYLLKDNVTDVRTLMDSLARVAAGETVIDPVIVRRLLERNRQPSKIDSLNERERAVLGHMAEGRSNMGIAKDLFLSPRTVEAHVTSIFVKLGLDQAETDNNRVRAVLAFLRSADAGSLSRTHLRMITSFCPNAAARSSSSRRTVNSATTSPIPGWPTGETGGLSSSVTRTCSTSRRCSRDTDAAVARGMVFRASRMVITTSATPSDSVSGAPGSRPSPGMASEPGAIPARMPVRRPRGDRGNHPQ